MHRPASVSRLFALIFTLAIGGILFSTRGALTDSVVPVTSLSALSSNDSVAWSQLGADGTSLLSTINTNSLSTNAITGTLVGSGSLTAVVCPASPCSWGSSSSGGFNAGDALIWTSDTANGGNGPLKLAFNTAVNGAGALIQGDGPGQFTAQIQAFNGTTSLGTFTTTSDVSGDAVFLGVVDNTAAHITSVVYSLVAPCVGACSDFAIDTLFIKNSGGPTPTATGTTNATPAATATGSPTATPTETATVGPTPLPTTSMLGVPALMNFGNVDASGSSKLHKVSIVNKGTVNALVGIVSVPSGFSMVSDLCSNQTILPKKSCPMMVQFAPTTPGPGSGSVSAPYNGGTATVSLSGNGTPVSIKAPTTVVFAPVAAGSMGNPKLVTFINLSKTATVQMGSAPTPGGPFSIASDTCSGMPIGPRGKCIIGLQFAAPQDAASKSVVPGTLDVSFTYGLNAGLVPTISLMGKVK
jgi:hypothetical protein